MQTGREFQAVGTHLPKDFSTVSDSCVSSIWCNDTGSLVLVQEYWFASEVGSYQHSYEYIVLDRGPIQFVNNIWNKSDWFRFFTELIKLRFISLSFEFKGCSAVSVYVYDYRFWLESQSEVCQQLDIF